MVSLLISIIWCQIVTKVSGDPMEKLLKKMSYPMCEKFLNNLYLAPKLDRCPDGSCKICCCICRYTFVYDDGEDE